MNATCSSRSSTLSVVRPPSEAQRPSQSRGSPPVLFRALGGATNQRYAGRGGPRPSLLVRCSQRKPDAHPHVSPRAEDPWEETWTRWEHTSTQAAAHLNCCRMVQNCPCPALGAGRCALPWCRGAAPGAAPRSTHQQQSPEGGARAHDTPDAILKQHYDRWQRFPQRKPEYAGKTREEIKELWRHTARANASTHNQKKYHASLFRLLPCVWRH